jgi:hypothetical protein
MQKYVLIFALLSSAASGQVGLFVNFAQWADMPAEGFRPTVLTTAAMSGCAEFLMQIS